MKSTQKNMTLMELHSPNVTEYKKIPNSMHVHIENYKDQCMIFNVNTYWIWNNPKTDMYCKGRGEIAEVTWELLLYQCFWSFIFFK